MRELARRRDIDIRGRRGGRRTAEAVRLDLFSGGTYTRTGTKYVQSDADSLVSYAANNRAPENRGLGDMLNLECSRSNVVRGSTPVASATVNASATPTYSSVDGPLGASTACSIAFAAVAAASTANQFGSTPADNVLVTVSAWLRVPSGTGTARLCIRRKDGATFSYSPDIALDTTWRRYQWTSVSVGAGATTPLMGIANGTDAVARTVETACWQAEGNSTTWQGPATSYIHNPGASFTTRGNSVLNYSSAQYPESFLTDGFRFTIAPDWSSADYTAMGSSFLFTILAFQSSTGVYNTCMVQLIWAAAGPRVFASSADTGLSVLSPAGALSWSREQEITIDVRPSAGTVNVAGATTGDGTYAGTAGAMISAHRTMCVGSRNGASIIQGMMGRLGRYVEAL